jgi:hypothetical protein
LCLLPTWTSMWYYIILKELFFLLSLKVRNKNCGKNFHWILYNNEISYKGGNITSNHTSYVNWIIFFFMLVLLFIVAFFPLCGPTIIFTNFVKSTTVMWHLDFRCIYLFVLVGPHDFCPFVPHVFFPSNANGRKTAHHLFVFWMVLYSMEIRIYFCVMFIAHMDF